MDARPDPDDRCADPKGSKPTLCSSSQGEWGQNVLGGAGGGSLCSSRPPNDGGSERMKTCQDRQFKKNYVEEVVERSVTVFNDLSLCPFCSL